MRGTLDCVENLCQKSVTTVLMLQRKEKIKARSPILFAFDWKIVLTGFVSGLIVGVILGNEYFTKIVEWFATNNLWWQLTTTIKRKTRGHRN